MKPNNDELIIKLKEHCEEVSKTVKRFGDNYETFISDKVFYMSSSWSIMFIGLIAKDLSDKYKEEHKDIQWNELIDMGRQLKEEFDSVDSMKLWNILNNDVHLLYEEITE